MGFIACLKKHPFLKNLTLAVCLVLIFIALAQVVLSIATRHGQAFDVPDFNGMTMAEAEEAAHPARLTLEIIDSLYLPTRTGGTILEQNPSPGSKVKAGRRIFMTINAFNPRTAQIPYVTGYSLRQAKNNLEIAGFEIERLIYQDNIAVNNVLEERYNNQTITAGTRVMAPVGAGIVLVVGRSAAKSYTRVPNVTGFTLKDAKSRLWEQGLNVGTVTRGEGITEINLHRTRVSRQSLATGTSQALGSTVNLTLTLEEGAQ